MRDSKRTGYSVYMLECGDGSLYTGIAKDLERRLKEHNRGRASKYTRSRLPVSCVYSRALRSRSEALKKEIEIKRLDRRRKLSLAEKAMSGRKP